MRGLAEGIKNIQNTFIQVWNFKLPLNLLMEPIFGVFTGLDPAGPMYDTKKGLNATCAQFVQVLHTSKFFGAQQKLGHSDFYANKNKAKQPGCMMDTCNHSRATELYYASCFPENSFIGADCNGGEIQSRFGFYNDGKSGCFEFETSACFGYALPSPYST